LCYSNADLTRADRDGELMRFVESRHATTATDPPWLYSDSKLISYSEVSRVNRRGIHLVTIRRRGAAILRRLGRRPASDSRRAVVDTPKRCRQRIRYLQETVHPRGCEGPIRQIAVTGLGHDQPTLFLPSHPEETPRELIIRDAGRNRIEDGLGISVDLFRPDRLAGEVRPDVDPDAALTAIANGCYRWLASRLRGFREAAPKQLYRRSAEAGGAVQIEEDRIRVTFERRSHDPVLREAALGREPIAVPGWGGRRLVFAFR
jgi:hypothetical protein